VGTSNFTIRFIEGLEVPKDKRYSVFDSQARGLAIAVHPSGARTFFYMRKWDGLPRRKTIGGWGDVDIETARTKTAEYNAEWARWKMDGCVGVDPFAKPEAGEPTLNELVEAYISRHLLLHAKRPKAAEQNLRWMVAKYLKNFLHRKVSTINRQSVRRLHDEMGEAHQFTANRVLQTIKSLYNFAEQAEMWTGPNPCKGVKLYHEPKRTRFVQPDELPRFFVALHKERKKNRDLTDFVNLCLWLGARKSDVLSLRWENISLADNRLTIPDPKNRRPYIIPVTPEASAILESRLRTRIAGNPWVFPSHGASGHVVDLKSAWKKFLQRAQIENLRIHDLRRTQGSWQAAQGTSLQIIGKSLGHSSVQATAIYSQLGLDPVRAAMTAANAAMVEASKKKVKLLAATNAG
jgi:integrase